MILASFDCETVSELNDVGHWVRRHKRTKLQKQATAAALVANGFDPEALLAPGRVIILVRIARGTLDEGDNLASSMKHVRDAVAAWFNVDDGPKGPLKWAYAQEHTRSPLGKVRIEVGA